MSRSLLVALALATVSMAAASALLPRSFVDQQSPNYPLPKHRRDRGVKADKRKNSVKRR